MKLLVLVSLLVAAESAKLSNHNFGGLQSGSSISAGNTFTVQGRNNGFSGQSNAFSGLGSNSFSSSLGQGGSSSSNSFSGQNNAFISQGSNSFSSSLGQGSSSSSSSFSGQSGVSGQGSLCRDGEFFHVDGRCRVPVVSNYYYAYNIPEQPSTSRKTINVPPPKVENNVLFVHLPREAGAQDPIVIPPPRQNNIVYILKKKSGQEGPSVIPFPEQPKKRPEVFFVNYNQGENPTLPGGIDLQTALGNAAQETGKVIDGSGLSRFGGQSAGGLSSVQVFDGQSIGGSGSSGFGGQSDGGFSSGQGGSSGFIGQSFGGFSSGQGFGDQLDGGFSSGQGFGGQSASGFTSGQGFSGQSAGGFSSVQPTSGFGSSNRGFSNNVSF